MGRVGGGQAGGAVADGGPQGVLRAAAADARRLLLG